MEGLARFVRALGGTCAAALTTCGATAGIEPVGEWCMLQYLRPAETTLGDSFATSFDLDDRLAIAGAPGWDEPFPNAGRAYIFDVVAGSHIAINNPSSSGNFGFDVAIDSQAGVACVVTKFMPPTNEGLFIFRLTDGEWAHEATLFGGKSVAIDGDRVLSDRYMHRFDGETWVLEAEFVPPPDANPYEFGDAVAMDGDVAIIGAPGDDEENAFIYRLQPAGGWSLEADFSEHAGFLFGTNVAIRGDLAVVASGAWVWIFRDLQGSWTLEFQEGGFDGTQSGLGVGISEDAVLVGATDEGRIYIFRQDGAGEWSEDGYFGLEVNVSHPNGYGFGQRFSVDGARVFAGQSAGSPEGGWAGVFVIPGSVADFAITDDPEHVVVNVGEAIELQIGVTGDETPGAVDYWWRRNGAFVTDDEHTSGASTSTLRIDPASGTHIGMYTGFAQPGCGEIFSTEPTQVVVISGVPGDLNADGVTDGADLPRLLSAWGPCPAPPLYCAADMDSDGDVDGADLALLLSYWTATE